MPTQTTAPPVDIQPSNGASMTEKPTGTVAAAPRVMATPAIDTEMLEMGSRPSKMQARDLNLHYGTEAGAQKYQRAHRRARHHRTDRPVRLRQKHLFALPQSHERL